MNKLLVLLSGGPLNGLKMLVGYLLANVAAGEPLFIEAVNKLFDGPTLPALLNVVGQALLIWGGVHDVVKKAK